MRSLLALSWREISMYFVSPVAYVVMTFFLAIMGLIFWAVVAEHQQYQMPIQLRFVYWWPRFLSVVITPFITMRLLAEEKNRGTLERLMTAPINDWMVVLSKFFAALAFYFALLIPTSLFAFYLSMFTSLDIGELVGAYLGLIFITATMITIGLFISSLCANQISAGIITFAVALLLFFTDYFIKPAMPKGTFWEDFVSYVNLMSHTETFIKGIVDTKDIVFYLSVMVLFLFWTVRVVESRRWK